MEFCENDMITLNGSGAQTYIWDNNVLNNTPFNQDIGTQLYHVIGTDAFGCSNSDSVLITVHPLPTVTGYYDTMVCEYELITLFGGGAVNYSWSNGIQNNVPFQQQPGSYTYIVTGTDSNNCENIDDVSIVVFPQPIAAFEVNQNDLMFAFINQSTGATNYVWDLGDGTSLQEETNVYHYYADLDGSTYTVSLIAVSEFGCLDTANIQVTSPLPILLYVPNAFTPDNDEHNNIFYPVLSGNADLFSYEMNIFDRWGELIFTSQDISYGWDGFYLKNNTKVQQGVYTWQIKFKKKTNDDLLMYHGFVTLIR
jgi:gliding motility-associated-like protein